MTTTPDDFLSQDCPLMREDKNEAALDDLFDLYRQYVGWRERARKIFDPQKIDEINEIVIDTIYEHHTKLYPQDAPKYD